MAKVQMGNFLPLHRCQADLLHIGLDGIHVTPVINLQPLKGLRVKFVFLEQLLDLIAIGVVS